MLIKPQTNNLAKIKVIGVGGGGGNAVNNMIDNYDIEGVEFIAVNTDAQALAQSNAEVKLRIGEDITRGLGSGGNPTIGKKAAEESIDLLHEHLAGADMVFVTAGMGGGTGTGASPVIAGVAKNLGALTVGIVTKPFKFEGRKRMETALSGIDSLKDKVDTLIVVPNQKLLDVIDQNISFLDAMKQVDDVLAHAVRSISHLITQAGLINVDFADVKSIMQDAGTALMGMGSAKGDDRAQNAAQLAVSSPLLEVSIEGAKGVLFNVIAGSDLAMYEVDQAAQFISDSVDADANIIFGATIDPDMKEEMQITVLATGFDTQAEDAILTNTADKFNQNRPGTNDREGGTGAQLGSSQASTFGGLTSGKNNMQQQTSEGQQSSRLRESDQEQQATSENSEEPYIVSPEDRNSSQGNSAGESSQQVNKPKKNNSKNNKGIFPDPYDDGEDDLETPSFLRRKKDY
jgi:cell division protein FtsZ